MAFGGILWLGQKFCKLNKNWCNYTRSTCQLETPINMIRNLQTTKISWNHCMQHRSHIGTSNAYQHCIAWQNNKNGSHLLVLCCQVNGILHSDWLSGLLLQKLRPFVCNSGILRDLFEKEYHSNVNCDADSKSVLEIKWFVIFMPHIEESFSGNQNTGFQPQGPQRVSSFYTQNTQDRLNKSHSSLAVVQLKRLFLQICNFFR